MNSSKNILLHICCGPCAIMPALRLADAGFNVTLWFMNPNIQPLSEYFRRRDAACQCAERLGMPLLFDDSAWNLPRWLARQMPGAQSRLRCHWCCQSRLEAASLEAARGGYDFFSTSLLYSRYQPHAHIAARGAELSRNGGPCFYYRDFREDWQAGIDKSKEWGLYRQPYCGCVFSEAERYAKKLAKLQKQAEGGPTPQERPGPDCRVSPGAA